MHTRNALVATSMLVCMVGVSACSQSSTPTAAPDKTTSSMPMHSKAMHSKPMKTKAATPAAQPASITISNYAFQGPKTVSPGATIKVMNTDSVSHTVTADSGGAFDVTVDAGGTASFKAPTKPGSYPYHCTFHSNMHATLVVK